MSFRASSSRRSVTPDPDVRPVTPLPGGTPSARRERTVPEPTRRSEERWSGGGQLVGRGGAGTLFICPSATAKGCSFEVTMARSVISAKLKIARSTTSVRPCHTVGL